MRKAKGAGVILALAGGFLGDDSQDLLAAGENLEKASRLADHFVRVADALHALDADLQMILLEDRDSGLRVVTDFDAFLETIESKKF